VPHDRDARPSLDEAFALRLQAMAMMRQVVDGLIDEQLDSRTEPTRILHAVRLRSRGHAGASG